MIYENILYYAVAYILRCKIDNYNVQFYKQI